MDLDLQEYLEDHLNQFATLPFLFVGSGLSRRYINLEDWESLLAKYCETTGKPFSFYRTSADGSLPEAGKLIARDFHECWYHNSDLETLSKWDTELIDNSSPLKIEISKYLFEKSTAIMHDDNSLNELELLKKANFDGIITTNWDALLENLFPDFHVYVGQNELLNSNPQMIGEIYKIHGSCVSPNSLVLTSDDYEKFTEKNPYLIAKLLAIFIEHPVIFLGYSLKDENIRKILDDVISCLNKDNLRRMEKQLIFVEWDVEGQGNKIYNDYSSSGNNTIPITVIRTNDFSAIFRALGSLERKIPIRILRLIKEQLYDLVVTNDPKERIAVTLDIDDEEELKDIHFVLGVGEIKNIGRIGYSGVKAKHLIQDLIFDDLECNPRSIVSVSWPNLRGKWNPVFKYLREAGYLSEDGVLEGKDLHPKILDYVNQVANNPDFFEYKTSENKRREIRESDKNIPERVKEYDTRMVYYITLIKKDMLNIEELEDYLQENYERFESGEEQAYRSFYHKLVCYYDWLKYGPTSGITVNI